MKLSISDDNVIGIIESEETDLMEKKNIEKIVCICISPVLIGLIIWLFIGWLRGDNKSADYKEIPVTEDSGKKLFENAVEVEEVVTVNTEIIAEGLREMGILITEEYYFTQVEEYTSTKKWAVFESEASFTYSYDGVVSAGIDCNEIEIKKNDETKVITISIPTADILSVNIDHDSFKIYEEKNGIWNKVNLESFNNSIIEFENAAKEKALEKDIINKADEGAQKMIESFVNSLIDSEEYTIEYVTK